MVLYENWWDVSSHNNQDYFFSRFFEAACADWEGLQHTDIAVCSVFGSPHVLAQPSHKKVRIFFVGENLNIMHQHFRQNFDATTDIQLGFTNFFGSSKFMYFPLYLIYWDFWSQGLFSAQSNENRNDKAVIVANHSAGGLRTAICQKVAECGVKIDGNREVVYPQFDALIAMGGSCTDKREKIAEYKYNICPENSIAPGYTTEKLFESFYSGCIPIYWGAPCIMNIIRPQYFVNLSEETLESKLSVVKQPEGLHFWNENALQILFYKYAVLWVKVWQLLKAKHTTTVNVTVKNDNVLKVMYKVQSYRDAIYALYEHWNKYNHLFIPRAQFMIQRENNKQMEWEEIIEKVEQDPGLALVH